jgi:hypothetical protein
MNTTTKTPSQLADDARQTANEAVELPAPTHRTR